ncbi:MAG: SBBP repeat-containing protein [Myxococcales bacterium]|nr:SBBP repeat-containing protein [Myxococcales bacterium]
MQSRSISRRGAVAVAATQGCLALASVIVGCGAPIARPDGAIVRDSGVVDASGPCPAGASLCGEVCIDSTNDRTNCGGCGVVCGFGVPCVAGRCDDGNCPMGQVRCGDRCADPRTSPEHCGGCGNPCDRGFACTDGRCDSARCLDGFARCGADCAEFESDVRHCGRCGNACGMGQACVSGTCVMSMCRDGLTQCGTTCTDPRFDPRHCGACGRSCASTQRCSLGRCEEIPCAGAGMSRCGQLCINLNTDPTHCGMCNLRCASGMCSAGRCVVDALRPRWAVQFGTVGEDTVNAVAIDPSGNVYVTGAFDGPMTILGRTMLTTRGRTDVFVASFTSAGALRWARSIGGRGADEGTGLAVGSNGRLYVTGYFTGEFVTETQGTIVGPGQLDGFLLSLDLATGAELAVLTVGGIGFEVLSAVSFRGGRLMVGGRFSDEIRMGTTRYVSTGRDDGLLFAADPLTLRPLWTRTFGGVNDDRIQSVLVDDAGRVFFGGGMEASLTWGRSTLVSSGQSDGFVASTDSVGTPQWAVRFGGAEADSVMGIESDGAGGIMAAGFFRGTAQYPNGSTIAARGSDVIAFPLSGAGVAAAPRIWGSPNDDTAFAIAHGPDGRWLLAGSLNAGADFGLGVIDTYFLTQDAFLAGFDASWRPRSIPTVQGSRDDFAFGVAIAPDNSAVWGGTFTNGGNLGLGFVTGLGGADGYIVYVGP